MGSCKRTWGRVSTREVGLKTSRRGKIVLRDGGPWRAGTSSQRPHPVAARRSAVSERVAFQPPRLTFSRPEYSYHGTRFRVLALVPSGFAHEERRRRMEGVLA